MIFDKSLNSTLKLTSIALCVLLTACGGSDSSSKETTPEPTPTPAAPTQADISGPHRTGSTSEPVFVYYDLDSQAVVELATAEAAAADTVWDIAFKRTGIYLNQNSENAITAYAMGNNSDFFDTDGAPIASSFIAANAETELAAYLAIKTSDIPTDETLFVGDITSNIIEGFYDYDSTTHVVSAADTKYFITNSDAAYTKFRATSIATVGQGIGEITLQTAYQGSSDVAFATEQALVIDAALTCSGDVTAVYVDFDSNQEVTEADAWDISLPCAEDKTSASFEINLADDAQALQDFDNSYEAIDPAAAEFLGFQSSSYSINAFKSFAHNWYQYALNGGHLLWSQFDIYLIKTPTTTHKLQITSYYDEEATSGNYSFRADEVTELAGEAANE